MILPIATNTIGASLIYNIAIHGLLNLILPDSRSKQPKNRRRLFKGIGYLQVLFFYY